MFLFIDLSIYFHLHKQINKYTYGCAIYTYIYNYVCIYIIMCNYVDTWAF